MERYLLFDSGCSLCTSLARQVEEAADGKLTARSLRDPEVRSILDDVKPGWRWEPMLLEVDGDRRRVYAGIGMRARLVQVLGPRRALAVAQYTENRTRSLHPGRRRFLQIGGQVTALGLFFSWLGRPLQLQGASIQARTLSPQPNLQPSGLNAEEDTNIRTDVLSDPSVKYLYAVTTESIQFESSVLLPNVQVLGYMPESDVYVVQWDLNAKPQFGNSIFLPIVSGEGNRSRAAASAPVAEAKQNSSERRLIAAYSTSQKKVLASFVFESSFNDLSENRMDVTLRFADRTMRIRSDEQQLGQPRIVEYHSVAIDEEIASRFQYRYDQDIALIWYRSQLGVVESADDQVCGLVCGIVFVAVCGVFPTPLCVAVGIVACSMVCSPKCVGEGC